MPTSMQNYPEFIINPICLDEVAQNFRTYAEQVAFYAELPDQYWEYPYNNTHGIRNPQYSELQGQSRLQVIAGEYFRTSLIHLFIKDGLYRTETPEDAITFSLFAALYIESLDTEEQS